MSFTGVMRPGHVAIRVLDLAEAVEYYVERVGLIKTDEDKQGRVYLKAWDELDCFSLILREADSPGIDFLGFKVHKQSDLDDFEGKLKEYGQNVERMPANELNKCGERVRFDSPTGHTFELYAEKEYFGDGLGRLNPNPWPEGIKGMQVHRFDHCLLYGSNAIGTVNLFREVLGFDLTEQVLNPDGEIAAAFLSCSNKAHDIAILEHPEPGKLHHVSFMLMTWEEVLRAADIMGMHEIPIDIGPTRHGITRGQTIYFFDPSGNRNEVFCGDYTWYPDREPITWMPEELGKAIFYHDRKLNESFLGVVT